MRRVEKSDIDRFIGENGLPNIGGLQWLQFVFTLSLSCPEPGVQDNISSLFGSARGSV